MASRENDPLTVAMEILAEIVLDKIGIVVANDSARSSFTVASGDSLLALDTDLRVLGQWPADPEDTWMARHLTRPGTGPDLRPRGSPLARPEGSRHLVPPAHSLVRGVRIWLHMVR